MMTRREFLAAAAAGSALAAPRPRTAWRLGALDAALGAPSRPDALEKAKQLGLAGVQVTLGYTRRGNFYLSDPELQTVYLEESRRHRVAIDGAYLDVLNQRCFKSDPQAREIVRKAIDLTRRLKAGVLRVSFSGDCGVGASQDFDTVAAALNGLAPEAEKAGVVLGLQTLLKAEDNVRLLERAHSRAVKVYYDVGNAVHMIGVDPASEIRMLGAGRICQFDFKDTGYLGEGKVDFPAVLKALATIDFRGYANLETTAPSGKLITDLARNVAFIRGLQTQPG
jgi:L-ribulose-5-phosphate 3-epimerase